MFGGFLFVPQYLQLVRDQSPLMAGVWTLPWSLAFVVGSNITPHLARHVRASRIMAGGLVLAALGFALLATLSTTSSIGVLVVGSMLFSLGTSPIFMLTNDVIIGAAPPERAGAAAGMSETAAELGGSLGIAVFGSIGLAIYRSKLDGGALDGVPRASAHTIRDTLGGAVDATAHLPAKLGHGALGIAQAAFTDGMQVAAVISAAAAIGLAVLVLTMLRDVHPHYAASADDTDDAALPALLADDPIA